MNTLIIVQARMGSSRLPGKVLKKVLDKPLLEYQIERLKQVKLANDIVVATTTNPLDDPIIELCSSLDIRSYRGSEHDVLKRYYEVGSLYKAEVVVRITADCPIIDPSIIDQVIREFYHAFDSCDYVSNTLKRTFPRGMDTEVFSFAALRNAHHKAIDGADREHVTPFIYRNAQHVRCVSYPEDLSFHRWTVDTVVDFILIEKILTHLYPQKKNFTMEDCVKFLNNNPSWKEINAKVEQNNPTYPGDYV